MYIMLNHVLGYGLLQLSISTYPWPLFHKTPLAEKSTLLALHPHTLP